MRKYVFWSFGWTVPLRLDNWVKYTTLNSCSLSTFSLSDSLLQSGQNNKEFLFVFLSSSILSVSFHLPLTLIHTPPHTNTISTLDLAVKSYCTRGWTLPDLLQPQALGKCPCECGDTWGVMNRRDLTLNPWPVHTNDPSNPTPLLSAMTASAHSQSPPKESKFIIYHFAYYFIIAPPPQHSFYHSLSLAPTAPLFALFTACELSTFDLEFSLECWADWA